MIRQWFDAAEAIAFGREIVRDIDRLIPADPETRTATSAKKNQKKLDALVVRTRAFAKQHKMNVYKKAKLLNTIKWGLRDAGHEEALVDEIIALLAPVLT
jgi:hypothetical protein